MFYLIKTVILKKIAYGTVDVFLYYKVGVEAPLTMIVPGSFGVQPIHLGGTFVIDYYIDITIPGPNIITGTQNLYFFSRLNKRIL